MSQAEIGGSTQNSQDMNSLKAWFGAQGKEQASSTSGFIAPAPYVARDTCPNCGYCLHCGRGGYREPYYPYYPPYPYSPWITYTMTNGGTF